MDKLEKAELVREKCGVSYADAQEALESCDYDVLDAIVLLEQEGKTQARTASYATSPSASAPSEPSAAMARAQQTYEKKSRRTKAGKAVGSFFAWLRKTCRAGLDTTFVAERGHERVVALPVLVLVLGLFLWGATIWLLVVGLFCGFRYHVEGKGAATIDVNDVMDQVADGVDSIKREFAHDDE